MNSDAGVILLFDSTRNVIHAERACRACGIAVEIVPVPRTLSSECGMALEVSKADQEAACNAITQRGIAVQAAPAG